MFYSIVIINSLNVLERVIYFAILIRILMSWVPISRGNAFYRIIYTLTEPILAPIRRVINNSPLGRGLFLDFSPIIAMVIIRFIISLISIILLRISL